MKKKPQLITVKPLRGQKTGLSKAFERLLADAVGLNITDTKKLFNIK